MINQPTETHLTKSKVGLLTPRHVFGPYCMEIYNVYVPTQTDALAHAMLETRSMRICFTKNTHPFLIV